jgi:hypothetical protein
MLGIAESGAAHRRAAIYPALEITTVLAFLFFRAVFFRHWLSPHITSQHNSRFGKRS